MTNTIKRLLFCLRSHWGMVVMLACFVLIPVQRLAAQDFTNLHNFTYGSDGAAPYGGLILSGNFLYGTASTAGSGNQGFFAGGGTVFKINTNGTGFTALHGFSTAFFGTNSDGASPKAPLILSGATLYGTTSSGGSNGSGVVFAVSTDGSIFSNLHVFTRTSGSPATNSDGASPVAGLVPVGNMFYGTAQGGGTSGNGTVFGLNTNGGNFSTLHNFTGGNDGAKPEAGLILSGNTFFGTAAGGGSAGWGTVYSMGTNGGRFLTLHSFTNGSDGSVPLGELVLSGNTLYGTTSSGGIGGNGGTVFAVNTNGSGFKVLHEFSGGAGGNDGYAPQAGLLLSGNALFGTASQGGSAGNGTVFAVNTDGTGYKTLYNFSALDGNYDNPDGAMPLAGLVQGGNFLYGTASSGGTPGNGHAGDGTLFGLLAPPQMALNLSGTNFILTWPASYTGFNLQTTMNLSASNWATVTPTAIVSNGQKFVTISNSAPFQFYRLKD